MQLRFLSAVCIAVAIVLGGCTSNLKTGQKIDSVTVATFKKGQTTYGDVVSAIGPPVSTMRDENGNTVASWMYWDSGINGVTVTPLAMFAPVNSERQTFTATFDQKNIMLTSSFEQSASCRETMSLSTRAGQCQ